MNSGPLTDAAHSEAAERLKAEVQEYLAAQAERLLVGAGHKLGEATGKLNDIAEGNSPGFGKLALDAGRKVAEGKGPVRSALELGLTHAKDTVMDKVKNLGGGKGKGKGKGSGQKPTVIMESVDVGVPVRTAYDQWTRYQDFSTFAKGVKSAGRSDDTSSDWQGKIWWSSRSWKGSTVEQIPDYRIQWSTEGAKGTHKGVVTFHRLDDNLTRVLLVIEYYPSGFFEKTANVWRASGRRARLDLKHYARHITLKGEVDDGWRGEIRDGEVVRSHEDAVAEEEENEDRDENGAEDENEVENEAENEAPEDEAYEDEAEEPYDEAEDAEQGEDEEYEAEGEEEPEGEYEDTEDTDTEETEDEVEPEDEEEYAGSRSRR
ncbi:SRPBCC family protein [Streptomyces sp. NBC_00631]|uniref:SRPBCC family protein n=1 Tax=Streptomyces sp. NBC_00631 TaxID=2975793 RepID=UPI0030E40A57